MRVLLSAPWKEAESFARARGGQDSSSLLVLGGLTPTFLRGFPARHKGRQGHASPFGGGEMAALGGGKRQCLFCF